VPSECLFQCCEPSAPIEGLMHSFQRGLSPPLCHKPHRPQLYCPIGPPGSPEPPSGPSIPFAVLVPRPPTRRRVEMGSQLQHLRWLLGNPKLRRNTGFENKSLNRIVRFHFYIGRQQVFVRCAEFSFSVFFSRTVPRRGFLVHRRRFQVCSVPTTGLWTRLAEENQG
jgi:hypothetical protein